MSRQIDIISTVQGAHYLLIGFDNDEIASFSLQLWITKYGKRTVDFVQSMGFNFITFIGGDLWIHNDEDANRCELFGEKRDCIVGVVSNEEPTKVKLYDSVGIDSNDEWEIYEITIPATLNHPSGMYSKIPLQRFKKRYGVWQAEFLRNMKTSSSTASAIEAITGEPLAGQYIYMKLRNTSHDQVKLFRVAVNQTLSKV